MTELQMRRSVAPATEQREVSNSKLRTSTLLQRLLRRTSGKTIYVYGEPYLTRYYLVGNGSGRGFEVYVHNMHKVDQFRWLHNHPWNWFLSIVLSGYYVQDIFNRRTNHSKKQNIRLVNLFRGLHRYHAIRELPKGEAWTLVLVPPKKKAFEWGYWNPESQSHIQDNEIGHESARTETFGKKVLLD